jgi:aspartate racemase
VALACTELPLVLNGDNCGMAAVDTTAVLAEAAMRQVLS